MNEDGQDNWVERRAQMQRHLASSAQEIWMRVCSSIESACESYRLNYCAESDNREVSSQRMNEEMIIVSRTFYPDRIRRMTPTVERIDIKFRPDQLHPKIEATFKDRTQVFAINADENRAFVEKDKSADAVSREILEPLLFPADEKRVPALRHAALNVPPLSGPR